MMNNRQLADTFTMVANLSEIKGENIYAILAYRKASESLMALPTRSHRILEGGKTRGDPRCGQSHCRKDR